MEDKRQEYSKNLTKMNRCNRIYNVAAIVYIGLFGFFMLEAFVRAPPVVEPPDDVDFTVKSFSTTFPMLSFTFTFTL